MNKVGEVDGKNFEYVLFLLKRYKGLWAEAYVKLLANNLKKRLENSIDLSFLFTFSNPLKIVILIVELCNTISMNLVFNKV